MKEKGWTDNDIFSFLNGFKYQETKKEVTEKYLKGLINKDEFIKRMKNARD